MSTPDDKTVMVDLPLRHEGLKPYLDALDRVGAGYHFVRTDFKEGGNAMKLELWVDSSDDGLTVCLLSDGTWTAHKTVKVEG